MGGGESCPEGELRGELGEVYGGREGRTWCETPRWRLSSWEGVCEDQEMRAVSFVSFGASEAREGS